MRTMVALVVLMLLSLLPTAITEHAGCALMPTEVDEAGNITFSVCKGELAGPEFSGETETVRIALTDVGKHLPGYVIRIDVEVRHVKFLAARYFVGYGPVSGGLYSFEDNVIRERERRTITFLHYVSEGELEDLVVAVSSIAFRDTPAVLNYTVKAWAHPLEQRDAPNDWREVGEAIPLVLGSPLEIDGWLSTRWIDKITSTYAFSRDTTDVYALEVKAEGRARVRVVVDYPRDSEIRVTLRDADGVKLDSATRGEVKTIVQGEARLFVELVLLSARSWPTKYTLRVEVVEEVATPEEVIPTPLAFSALAVLLAIPLILLWMRAIKKRND